jgi:hypothetical protein
MRFHSYVGHIKIAVCGSLWQKATTMSVALTYTYGETALVEL